MIDVLHVHSSFSLGGKEARAVALMNAWGQAARHTIVSGVPDALGARDQIAPGIDARFPQSPPLTGRPSVARYRAIAEFMRGFDLILTYNWGAMDAVVARRIYARDLAPLIHHEDGFNADEALRLKPERGFVRRLALPAASAVVVPSQTLQKIARDVWKQPERRVHRIDNGIPVSRYAAKPTITIPGLRRGKGEVVVGTLAGLRSVKNLPRLVRAALAIPQVRLVIVGEGPERDAIVATAAAMGATDRLVMPGFLDRPWRYLGHFDVFALSSDSEQFPISLVEAMAAGLPVVATGVGDVAAMLPPAQARFVVARDDQAMSAALRQLVADAALRRTLGDANRAHARAAFDERRMIAAYAALYNAALVDKKKLFPGEPV